MPVRDGDRSPSYHPGTAQGHIFRLLDLRDDRVRAERQQALRSVFGGWRRTSEAVLEASEFLPCPAQEYVDVFRHSGSAPSTPGGTAEAGVRPTLEPDVKDYSPPGHSSFLRPGMSFKGSQTVVRLESSVLEDWPVDIRLQDANLSEGMVCGSSAWHLPQGKTPVVTFWEGDIIDNVNHTFMTSKWGASQLSDMKHWSKFAAFEPLRLHVVQQGGRCGHLRDYSHIFMRWKEQCFLNVAEDCGLTIAGFYYVCLCRQTGEIEGFYVDPLSAPNHRLSLKACSEGSLGTQSFGAFQYR